MAIKQKQRNKRREDKKKNKKLQQYVDQRIQNFIQEINTHGLDLPGLLNELKELEARHHKYSLLERYVVIQKFRYLLSNKEMHYRVLVGNNVYDITGETLMNYVAPGANNTKLFLQIGTLNEDIKVIGI